MPGVDVFAPAERIDEVRERLLAAGAVAAGEDVAEIVRVEAGRPRYGIDLDETVIPQEAALNERAVSFTKGCYVGQETVARLFYKGKPNRHLRALRLSAPTRPARRCSSASARSAGSARAWSPPARRDRAGHRPPRGRARRGAARGRRRDGDGFRAAVLATNHSPLRAEPSAGILR
jgi:folate-binding protein YgfZ